MTDFTTIDIILIVIGFLMFVWISSITVRLIINDVLLHYRKAKDIWRQKGL